MLSEDSIQSLGGKARDKALTAEQKSEIAKKAAAARWPVQATHKGTFKEEFGIDVECYVLNDEPKTAVMSQTGVGQALGLSARGNAFPRFLQSKAMANFVGAPLWAKFSQPLKFQWVKPGAQGGSKVIYGYNATMLIEVAQAIVAAEAAGKLDRQQKHVAHQAHVILSASAKSGIKGLVYALGYNPTTEEVIAAFKMYVQEEAKKYEKEFPTELYAEWYRLYEIPILPRGKSWHFKHLTVNTFTIRWPRAAGKCCNCCAL